MLMCCTAASACLPITRMSPMWLTSKTPTPVRTAMCSEINPAYSTGMSHPPKSTIFAPRLRCNALSAVLRSCGALVVLLSDCDCEVVDNSGRFRRFPCAESQGEANWLSYHALFNGVKPAEARIHGAENLVPNDGRVFTWPASTTTPRGR